MTLDLSFKLDCIHQVLKKKKKKTVAELIS